MATSEAPAQRPDPVAVSRERFERETAEHKMTVRHDDGLYRHLRFQRPETWSYGFDLVTWPGFLAVVGDCGDYLFSRTADMFEFFEASGGRINPDYWSEKLQGGAGGRADALCRRYSPTAYRARVEEWLADQIAWGDLDDHAAPALREAVHEQLLAGHHEVWHNDSEHEARRLLEQFEHDGLRIEAWEWDLREYDWSFLWCCHAIVWGIAQYRASKPNAETVSASG